MAASQTSEERIIALELMVMHLERDHSALNASLLEQQKEIEALRRTIARLDDRIARLGEDEEPRDPGEERPPHY